MKMELNEAIERLNKAGLIVEDIYDNEEDNKEENEDNG